MPCKPLSYYAPLENRVLESNFKNLFKKIVDMLEFGKSSTIVCRWFSFFLFFSYSVLWYRQRSKLIKGLICWTKGYKTFLGSLPSGLLRKGKHLRSNLKGKRHIGSQQLVATCMTTIRANNWERFDHMLRPALIISRNNRWSAMTVILFQIWRLE